MDLLERALAPGENSFEPCLGQGINQTVPVEEARRLLEKVRMADTGDFHIDVSERVGADDAEGTIPKRTENLGPVAPIRVDVRPVTDAAASFPCELFHVLADGTTD
jgi:hypothetical protein